MNSISKGQTTHLLTFTQVTSSGAVPTQALLVRPTITIGNKVATTYLTLIKPVDAPPVNTFGTF